jgi:cell division protein FtsL
MAVGTLLLVLLISGPLLLVTKQVYITNISIRMNAVSDSLRTLNKEITALQLTSEQLSSIDRIESYARKTRQLEYPSTNQIVIVKMPSESTIASGNISELLAFVKKAIGAKS